MIALAPNSVQEMFDLTLKAFNLSESYRNPVIVLADEITGHMRERIMVPRNLEIIDRKETYSPPFFNTSDDYVRAMPPLGKGLNVLVTGSTHDARGLRATTDPEIHRKLAEGIVGKIQRDAQILSDVEQHRVDDCQVGVVSYGCTSRAVYTAIQMAEESGMRVGHVRLRTIWPFPVEAVQRLSERAQSILVPEMNLKQVYFEVLRAAEGRAHVVGLNKVGGGTMIYPEEILRALTRIIKGD
jgi:2-oxoglutarate ferredoxin oxidoreductase subunit alpha